MVLLSGHFFEVRQRIVRVRVRGGDWNRAQHTNVIHVAVVLGFPILFSFSIFRNRSRTTFVIVALVLFVGAVRIAFGEVIVTVVAHGGIPRFIQLDLHEVIVSLPHAHRILNLLLGGVNRAMQGGWICNIVADFSPITTNEAFARRHHSLATFALVDEPALWGRVSAEAIVDFLATSPVWLPSSIIELLVRRSVGRRRVSSGDGMFLVD